jgi:hypothetical protein
MFENIRESLSELLSAARTPEDRRAALAAMKDTIVRARMGLDDLRQGLDVTRKKLAAEQRELETVRRRKGLAEGINDAETVAVAVKFEQQHEARVAVLTKKLEAQQAELELVEREVSEMTAQLKSASAGVGTGLGGSTTPLGSRAASEAALDEELGLNRDAGLRDELDSLGRSARRSAREATAAERLAELKKRMGK